MDTHASAPNRYLDGNGIRYAYRQFGSQKGVPLLLLQHFRGGMDNWDPLVTDGLAQHRPVILVNGAGVGGSGGTTPDTIEAMADDIHQFLSALKSDRLDVLGFSIGGTIAQSLTLRHPDIVRRLVLVGTRPRGGESSGGRGRDPEVARVAGNPVPTLEDFLFLFFDPSPESQEAGRRFWDRRHERTMGVDPPSSPQILSQHIPDAQLIIYPKSGHGALFQYPALFVQHTQLFLDG
jgi:pimeloyl-ACP methyl ester carboxylesterase